MPLPDNIRIQNGGYEVHTRKGWENKTNFTLTLTGEVQHPTDTMYMARVQREDGVASMGFFALGDVYKSKDFATALNRSTVDGGHICLLNNSDLVHLIKALIKELKEQNPLYRKELVKVAGRQEGTSIMVINPEEVIHLDSGEVGSIEDTGFTWMNKTSLRPEMERRFASPTSVKPLSAFFDIALTILGPTTFGVGILAWASICTLPYVTAQVTNSTMPFVWDDPTTPDEVSQLAVDLGNAAVRGKVTDGETRTPNTGCLVTAIFSKSDMLKYFSRIVLLLVPQTDKKKETGQAAALEEAAKAASAAFPLVMHDMQDLTVDDIYRESGSLEKQLRVDIRILEGIALNLLLSRKILNLAGRYKYMIHVLNYTRTILIPYYMTQLSVPQVPTYTGPEEYITEAALDLTNADRDSVAIIKNGRILAIDQRHIREKNICLARGGKPNRSTKVR